jgi:hypothetical protein
MKISRIALICSLALGPVPFITGCDKTVEEKSTVTKTSDGGEVKDTKKETVSPDGKTVTKTEEHTNVPPNVPSMSETKDSTTVTVSPDGQSVTKTEEHNTTSAKP